MLLFILVWLLLKKTQHLSELEGQELKDEMVKFYKDSHNLYFYSNDQFKILKYIHPNGDNCIGLFRQLEDQYEDSEFVYESDKEFISKLVGRRDANGQDILLGDQVLMGKSINPFRVVWVKSGFWLFDEYSQCIEAELDTDNRLVKV